MMADLNAPNSHEMGGEKAPSHRHGDTFTFSGLNDDCILEILSAECLSIKDLCAVAETCSRLKDIAGRIFQRKYKQCKLHELTKSFEQAKRIIVNFGSVITPLRIYGGNFRRISFKKCVRIWDSVIMSGGDNLELLYVTECVVTENFMAKVGPTLEYLRKLTLSNCQFEDADSAAGKELFAGCRSLISLKIISENVEDVAIIAASTFPNLQSFTFAVQHGRKFVPFNLEPFISRHKSLRKLKIPGIENGPAILSTIADNCPQLEVVECRLPKDRTVDVLHLNHLRKLVIDCAAHDVTKLVQRLKESLEELTVNRATVDEEFFSALSQVKGLRALHLVHCDGLGDLDLDVLGDFHQLTNLEIASYNDPDLDVVRLIERLSKLKELRLTGMSFSLDVDLYLKIVEVVSWRCDKLPLSFYLYDGFKFYNELVDIMEANDHIVKLKLWSSDHF